MNYMFTEGFLGTRAPFFMDTVTLIVTILPLLLAIIILLAKKGHIKTHIALNILVYIVTIVVLGYFEYGVRLAGGYKALSVDSDVNHNYLLFVLILHIIIATLGILVWTYTIFMAPKLSKANPVKHKRLGITTFYLESLTSFSGVWVYLLLFVF